jgi:hypothetical protein
MRLTLKHVFPAAGRGIAWSYLSSLMEYLRQLSPFPGTRQVGKSSSSHS